MKKKSKTEKSVERNGRKVTKNDEAKNTFKKIICRAIYQWICKLTGKEKACLLGSMKNF